MNRIEELIELYKNDIYRVNRTEKKSRSAYMMMYRKSKGYKTYDSEFYKQRKKALERDGNKCQSCGSTNNLHVHHKDGTGITTNKVMNNNLDNLITYCSSCHIKLHKLT